MVNPVLDSSALVFRWNLTANVGKGQPNLAEDVELVRLGYLAVREDPKVPPRAELREPLSKLQPFGPYGPDLQAVIDAHQKIRGGTQDGIVSVAKISSTTTNVDHYDGIHTWIIVALDNKLHSLPGDIYPRIDKHPKCGPELKKKALKIFTF